MFAALNQMTDAIIKRFESNEKFVTDALKSICEAIRNRDQTILELQQVVIQLRKEVTDLQSTGVDKVLLESKDGNNT